MVSFLKRFSRWGLLLLLPFIANAQGVSVLSLALLPDKLKDGADTVILNQLIDVKLLDQQKMVTTKHSEIAVFNASGMKSLDLSEMYDQVSRISSIELTAYDAFGKKIRSFRKKDFRDVSTSDMSEVSDSRLLYLEWEPLNYPVTLVFDRVLESSNTAFLPWFFPIENYNQSIVQNTLTITDVAGLGLACKERNLNGFPVVKSETANGLSYTVREFEAVRYEDMMPDLKTVFPMVQFRTDKFCLEGVKGESRDWATFGKWYYTNMLAGTETLPEATKTRMKELVRDAKDTKEAARRIYEYMQHNTRYVSIQLGVGGFRPMSAERVDKLGYGDCKALTNYTRALLLAAGIESYYAVVHSGRGMRRNIEKDFVSVQGNHIILALPQEKGYLWLECTSQHSPFGYQGEFTDGRDVLLIKPDGGEIVHTHNYLNADNTRKISGSYTLTETGGLSGSFAVSNSGTRYDQMYGVEFLSPTQQEHFYKERFLKVPALKLGDIRYVNDKDNVDFKQEVAFTSDGYGQLLGNQLIFPVNCLTDPDFVPKKYRKRSMPFAIHRGYVDLEDITAGIPEGYSVESLPPAQKLQSKFGGYELEVKETTGGKIILHRKFHVEDGTYTAAEYEEYRKFCETVAQWDNAKVILTKKP